MPLPDFVKKIPAGYLPGLIAGVAAGFTRLHPEWAPLQIPALALLARSLVKASGISDRLRPGFWFGAAMAALVLGNVGVPVPAAAILFVAMTGYWMVLGAGLSHLLQSGGATGVFGAAGLLTLGEWAQTHAVRLFGTAQRLANSWVDYDVTLIFARSGGTLLITFLVAACAFEIAFGIRRVGVKGDLTEGSPAGAGPAGVFCETQVLAIVAAAILLITGFSVYRVYCLFGLSASERFPETVTVAACGAKKYPGPFLPPEAFLKRYLPMIEKASAQGAKIVVTPEMALSVTSGERDAVLARCADEARKLGVAWALGYAEGTPGEKPRFNRAVLLNAGTPVGESYDKTHRVYFLENYDGSKTGVVTGTVKTDTGEIKVGLMICHDDNYEDVSRELSLAGVQLALVPTWDWPGVEYAHLESARNRPRESGFVEVRATGDGISAIINQDGCVIASRNNLVEGDGPVIATVGVESGGPTLFARYGDRPVLILAGLAVGNALRRKRPAGSPARRFL